MKAIVNTAPNTLNWMDYPLPEPGPGQVRIRTAACGICATDIFMIAGWERTGFPAIPGHEWSGRVDAVGQGVDPGLAGQPCVAENVIADGGEVGFEHPGGYAQFLVTQASNVRPLPQDYPIRQAALIEPLAVVVRGVKKLHIPEVSQKSHPCALILGDGPIGLIMVMVLRHYGVEEITLAGGRAQRLALAKSFGAMETIDYHQQAGSLGQAILDRRPSGFTYVVEASGSTAAMTTALETAAKTGKVLVMGDYGTGRASFLWLDLLHRELELIGSNASAGAWDEAVHLAVHGNLPLSRLITHHFPAEQFQQGYELTRARSSQVVKVVLDWEMD